MGEVLVTELYLQRHDERVRQDRQYEWAIRVALMVFGLILVGIPVVPGIIRDHVANHQATHASHFVADVHPPVLTVGFCVIDNQRRDQHGT